MTLRAQVAALKLYGQSNAHDPPGARQSLGVTEGTVRYHLRRLVREDRRKPRPRKADALRATELPGSAAPP
jgi:hypothetical protein